MGEILKSIHSAPSSHKLVGLESEMHPPLPLVSSAHCLVCDVTLEATESPGGRACLVGISPMTLACMLYFLLYHNINMLLASCSCHQEPSHSAVFSLL